MKGSGAAAANTYFRRSKTNKEGNAADDSEAAEEAEKAVFLGFLVVHGPNIPAIQKAMNSESRTKVDKYYKGHKHEPAFIEAVAAHKRNCQSTAISGQYASDAGAQEDIAQKPSSITGNSMGASSGVRDVLTSEDSTIPIARVQGDIKASDIYSPKQLSVKGGNLQVDESLVRAPCDGAATSPVRTAGSSMSKSRSEEVSGSSVSPSVAQASSPTNVTIFTCDKRYSGLPAAEGAVSQQMIDVFTRAGCKHITHLSGSEATSTNVKEVFLSSLQAVSYGGTGVFIFRARSLKDGTLITSDCIVDRKTGIVTGGLNGSAIKDIILGHGIGANIHVVVILLTSNSYEFGKQLMPASLPSCVDDVDIVDGEKPAGTLTCMGISLSNQLVTNCSSQDVLCSLYAPCSDAFVRPGDEDVTVGSFIEGIQKIQLYKNREIVKAASTAVKTKDLTRDQIGQELRKYRNNMWVSFVGGYTHALKLWRPVEGTPPSPLFLDASAKVVEERMQALLQEVHSDLLREKLRSKLDRNSEFSESNSDDESSDNSS